MTDIDGVGKPGAVLPPSPATPPPATDRQSPPPFASLTKTPKEYADFEPTPDPLRYSLEDITPDDAPKLLETDLMKTDLGYKNVEILKLALKRKHGQKAEFGDKEILQNAQDNMNALAATHANAAMMIQAGRSPLPPADEPRELKTWIAEFHATARALPSIRPAITRT